MAPDFHILTAKMSRGDIQAYNKILDTHYWTVVLFVDRIIDDPMQSEEIAQDCFYKLYNEREKIENYNHLKGFLIRTARNASIDYLRWKKVQKNRLQEYILLNADSPVLENVLEREYNHAENRAEVDKVIKSCSRDQQMAFRLFVMKGLSANEVAEIMKIPQRRVFRLKNAVIDKLSQRFGDQQEGFIY